MTLTTDFDIQRNPGSIIYFAMFTTRAGACNKYLKIYKFSQRIAYFSSSAKNGQTTLSEYLEETGCKPNLKRLPAKLKRSIVKSDDTKLYIGSDTEASRIADAIKCKRKENVPLMEMRPGPGILTNYLIKLKAEPLLLYENDPNYVSDLRVGSAFMCPNSEHDLQNILTHAFFFARV